MIDLWVVKLFRLPRSERRLLVTAALLLAAIKLGLTVLPYQRLRRLVDRLARSAPRRRLAPSASPERIARAVTRASRSVPGATCLPQALAAKVLLDRNPDPSRRDVVDAISGNICRCTGYDAIINAILSAAASMRGSAGATSVSL